jgi:hypothetical protein
MIEETRMPSIQSLYTRLSRAGISKGFVRQHLLPPWWEDSIAASPAGYAEAAAIISRNLSVDLQSLFQHDVAIQPRAGGRVCFKKRQAITQEKLEWAQAIAMRAAELACYASTARCSEIPGSTRIMRDHILRNGIACVTLPVLLDYCWGTGIPVIHVSAFPARTATMDALSARVDGRPAIALATKHRQCAWLLFHVAHELGHIAAGHLDRGSVMVDEHIQTEDNDPEESDANRFALTLLAGEPELQTTASCWPRAIHLADSARALGQQHGVDPGVYVLNYAWTSPSASYNPWPVANRALEILEPEANAPGLVRSRMVGIVCPRKALTSCAASQAVRPIQWQPVGDLPRG